MIFLFPVAMIRVVEIIDKGPRKQSRNTFTIVNKWLEQ